MGRMARGWESKSVEDQMDAAANARAAAAKPKLTPEAMARQAERDGLMLSRARTLNALQGACDARYRSLLETTLAHVDEQIKQLDAAAASPASAGESAAASEPAVSDPAAASSDASAGTSDPANSPRK
jgi:hypothetical protein